MFKRLFTLLLLTVPVFAQNPQSQAPIYSVNAAVVNGVAPGYAPTQTTSPFGLNIGPGATNCSGQQITYAGGRLNLTPSTTNYVYLDTTNNCAVSVKLTPFVASDIPVATVITSSLGIATNGLTDNRTIFNFNPSSSFTAAHDLSGSNTNQTVVGLRGIPLSTNTPTTGQALVYNGESYQPATVTASAAGSTGQVQVNNNGQIGAANFTYDSTGNNLTIPTGGGIAAASNPYSIDTNGSLVKWDGALNALHSYLATTNQLGFPQTIDVIGDSLSQGIGPNDIHHSGMYQLRTILNQFGSVGTGVIPIGGNPGLSTRPEWSLAGNWSTVNDLGPFQNNEGAFGTTFVASGSGSTATLSNQPGDSFTIYGETKSDSTGCTVTVDGGNTYTFGNNATANPTVYIGTQNVPAGIHNFVVSPNSTGSCAIYGIAVNQTGYAGGYTGFSGVRLNNWAHGNIRSEGFAQASQFAYIDADAQLPGHFPDLFIVELGANDVVDGQLVTPAQYTANMNAILTYITTHYPLAGIMILDIENVGANFPVEPGGITQLQYRAIERQLAIQYKAQYVSIAETWGPFTQANQLGLYANDLTHPSDSGGISIGAMLGTAILGQGVSGNQSGTAGDLKHYYPRYLTDSTNYEVLNANQPGSGLKADSLFAGTCVLQTMSGGNESCFDLGFDTDTGLFGADLFSSTGSEVMFTHSNSANGLIAKQSDKVVDCRIETDKNNPAAPGNLHCKGNVIVDGTISSSGNAPSGGSLAKFASATWGAALGGATPTGIVLGGSKDIGVSIFTTPATGLTTGTIGTFTFTNAFTNAPVCMPVMYGGSTPIVLGFSSTNNNTITITTNTVLEANTQYAVFTTCELVQ